MSRRIFAHRTSHPPTFKSRIDYLEARGLHSSSLCSVLHEFSVRPWVTVTLGSGWLSEREREAAMGTILERLQRALADHDLGPWLQELPDGADLIDTARRYAADMTADHLSIAPVRNLPSTDGANPGITPQDPGDVWVAKVLVTAMLTTTLYFTLRALDPTSAMHRPGHEEEAAAPVGTTALWPHRQLTARVLQSVKGLAADLGAEGSGARILAARVLEGRNPGDLQRVTNRFLGSFTDVVDSLHLTLEPPGGAPPRLESGDVRALTELAWFSVSTFADGTYPGWLDLLLELSHYDKPEHGSVGRPSFDNVTDAGESIRARYQRLTTNSWNRRPDQNSETSPRVHDSVARLLLAQSKLREGIRSTSNQERPPPAVVHVTSFDLELEMALLRAAQPFSILFPVHVLDTLTNLLHLRWCQLEVTGTNLDAVLRPGPDAVTVLSGQSREIDRLAGPFVVRLTGCPLIELPSLARNGELTSLGHQVFGGDPNQESRQGGRGDRAIRKAYEEKLKVVEPKIGRDALELRIAREVSIRHAILVNEHDAMLQNAMDSQPWSDDLSLCRRLPIETVADDRGWRRFWMLLGVQVADHAVRQRVSHVVSWYPESDERHSRHDDSDRRTDRVGEGADPGASGGATPNDSPDADSVTMGTSRLGVLVSRTVGHIEQDLLYWNRFDIVENSEAHLFAEDLDHLTRWHLGEADAGSMIRCQDG